MLNFLDLKNFIKNKTPITNTELLDRDGSFHRKGLFSEEIFGTIGSKERRETFSFIDLGCQVVHPAGYRLLKQLDRKILKFLSTEESFSLDNENKLIVDENGVTGLKEFIQLFPKINFRGETDVREKYIKKLKQIYKTDNLFIDNLPVIPPDFRPAYEDQDGQWMIDSLNDIYISILRKSFQVKGTGEGELYDLLNYDMQQAIIKHDDYIREKLGKKHGAIRNLTLGKRADYTGRGVATAGPDLKTSEIGIPFRMAVKLFEPFILYVILRTKKIDNDELDKLIQKHYNEELSLDSLQRILNSIKSGDELPIEIYKLIWDATVHASEERVVIAKRDPVLHQQSLRAFFVKIVDGNTIRMQPLVASGYNLDYDGDQLAIYHPITNESQQECKEKMMNQEMFSSSTSINFEFTKEINAGLYVLTKDYKSDNSPFELLDENIDKQKDPTLNVIYKGKTTTAGKAIFNSCLPHDYEFVDKLVNKKVVNGIMRDIVEKYDNKVIHEVATKIKDIGYKFSTIYSPSITMDDIQIPSEIMELKQKLEGATSEEADNLLQQMEVILKEHLKETGLYDLIDSGSTKGWSQPLQILVARGVLTDTEGKLLDPIKSSLSDGMTPTEYFKASAGSRRGVILRVHGTADGGYMARKMVYLMAPVEVHPTIKDCRTKGYLAVRATADLLNRLTGRYVIEDNKVEKFKKENYSDGDIIHLRTPIFCKSYKVCHTCYGDLVKRFKSPFVGMVAAQVLSEKATQMILRVFHTGGAAVITKRNILKDIIENDPTTDLKYED